MNASSCFFTFAVPKDRYQRIDLRFLITKLLCWQLDLHNGSDVIECGKATATPGDYTVVVAAAIVAARLAGVPTMLLSILNGLCG